MAAPVWRGLSRPRLGPVTARNRKQILRWASINGGGQDCADSVCTMGRDTQ